MPRGAKRSHGFSGFRILRHGRYGHRDDVEIEDWDREGEVAPNGSGLAHPSHSRSDEGTETVGFGFGGIRQNRGGGYKYPVNSAYKNGGFASLEGEVNSAAMPSASPVVVSHQLSDADADLVTSCPVCMEMYSDTCFPIVVGDCGHSMCIECRKQLGSGSEVCACAMCGAWVTKFNAFGGCSVLVKNYALLDLVSLRAQEKEKFLAETMKLEKERSEKDQLLQSVTNELAEYKRKEAISQDSIDCSKCHTSEKMERMKICETCTGKGEEVDWKDIEEEKILPLCAFCSYCRDDHKGHVLREYLPWKLKKIVASTVSDGKSTVLSMDEVCFHEIERGKEQLKKWVEEIDMLRDVNCESYEEALSTVAILKEESDVVCNASEKTLPNLRMFTKVLRDSTARLSSVTGERTHAQEQGESEEDL